MIQGCLNGVSIVPRIILSDGAEAIPNGAQEVWDDIKKAMCPVNVLQAIDKHAKRITDRSVRARLTQDLKMLFLAWSEECSDALLNLCFEKWDNVDIDGVQYFLNNYWKYQ